MKYHIVMILILFCGLNLYGQDSTDAVRLKSLEYMEYADQVDCENMMGTTLEDRVCLNLKFQRLDSIVNVRFTDLLRLAPNDSIREQLISFQNAWVLNRRAQSEIASEGYRGHMLGIIYLASMVETTRGRINEIELILSN